MVLHCEPVAGHGVNEVVVNDAVIGGVEAGGDGVVVGEGGGGEYGNEALLGLCAAGNKAVNVGSRGLELVPAAESVGGNEEDDGAREFGERPRPGGAGSQAVGKEDIGDHEEEEDPKGNLGTSRRRRSGAADQGQGGGFASCCFEIHVGGSGGGRGKAKERSSSVLAQSTTMAVRLREDTQWSTISVPRQKMNNFR